MSKPKHEGAGRAKPPAQGPGDGQDEIIDNRSPPTIARPIRARRAYFNLLLFIISSQVIRQKVRQADDRAKPEDHHDPVKQDLATAAAGLRSESGVGRARCLWRRAGQSGVLGHVSSLHEHALAACKAGGGSDGQARGCRRGAGLRCLVWRGDRHCAIPKQQTCVRPRWKFDRSCARRHRRIQQPNLAVRKRRLHHRWPGGNDDHRIRPADGFCMVDLWKPLPRLQEGGDKQRDKP